MSNAQVVYADMAQDSGAVGALFKGRKFWIAQRCPMRSRFVEDIKRNGGTIVPLEKNADWLIVDHARKDGPVGGTSYRFIEECIKAGELLDTSAFASGPPAGTARAVGSTVRPARGIRQPFTAEDDRVLREWVMRCLGEGNTDSGNLIYKQLEAQNNRHTWQSWRDRWIKRLRTQQHEVVAAPANNSPPTPPSDDAEEPVPTPLPARRKPAPTQPAAPPPAARPPVQPVNRAPSLPKSSPAVFSATQFHELFRVAPDIQDMTVRDSKRAFAAWAADGSGTSQTGPEWQALWDLQVQPVYEIIEAEKGRMKIYKEHWLDWSQENNEGTADEWVAYWENKVRPKVEKVVSGEEEDEKWDESPVVNEQEEEEQEEEAQDAIPPAESAKPKGSKAAQRETTPEPVEENAEEPGSIVKSGASSTSKRNVFLNRSSQPLKRRFDEAEIQDSPEQNMASPNTKRMRMHLDSATKAGKKLNAVLVESPSRGARAEPIEIVDSTSSSSDDEDVEVPREAEQLPQDTPTRQYARKQRPGVLPATLVLDADDEELDEEDGAAPLNRQVSPTLSFTAFPSNMADQTQFPAIHPYEDEREDLGSSPPYRPQLSDTQAILEADTQPFRFSLPAPDFSDEEFVDARDVQSDPDSPLFVSTPEKAPQVSLAVHITNLVDRGHSEANILISLRCTSMDRDLASIVLESLEAGRGIPEHIRGIWTEKDDIDAEGGNARMIRRVREKHGEYGLGGFLGRLEFLHEYRLR